MTPPHFLLTRFNVATPGREVAVRNAPGWLERRFDLFERYCLPSVAANRAHAFTWLVYFDRETPDRFRQRIAATQQACPFVARFIGPLDKQQVIDDVRSRLPAGTRRVLTTRLDNDDAIARDFLVRSARAAADQPDGTVVNFPRGIAASGGALFAARDESNPFTTLVESATDLRTIWSVTHDALQRHFRIVQVDAPPAWLQVIHGDNVTNRIKGHRLDSAAVLEGFAICPRHPVTPTRRLDLFLDRTVLHPLRRLREGAISLAKMLLRRAR